jgi:acyl-CoA synthetase (NDP forming)
VDPAQIAGAVRRVFDCHEIAGVVAVNVGLDIPEFAAAIVAAANATGKPAVAFTADAPDVTERFRSGGVPVLASPERAVRAWRALWQARGPARTVHARATRLPDDVIGALEATSGPLPYALARRALEACGVRFCREAIVATSEEAKAAAAKLGFPVVIKADVTGLTHKTETGGVRLDVANRAAVAAACRDLRRDAGAERFVVQERIGPGVELLIGARRDPVFGPVVAVGAGGVLTEVIGDVTLRLAPLAGGEAAEMLSGGARARLLAGPRGLRPVDPAVLAVTIEGVGRLAAAHPRIVEIDVNPVIAAGADVIAVDALVIAG